MYGIVVLEGPDCTGKSTLAEAFKREHNAVVIHAVRRWPQRMWQYHGAILRKAAKLAYGPSKRLVVLDRHWPSEMVYGRIFRPTIYNKHSGLLFDSLMGILKVQYIWCMPTEGNTRAYLNLYKKNIDSDHPYNEDQIVRVLDAYKDIYYGYSSDKTVWATPPLSYEELLCMSGGLKGRPNVTHYDLHIDNPLGVLGAVADKLEQAQLSGPPVVDSACENFYLTLKEAYNGGQ